MSNSAERVVSPLMDRLQPAPDSKHYTLSGYYQNLKALQASVAKDIEYLLNTVQSAPHIDWDTYPEAAQSFLNFGLPDFIGKSLNSPDDRSYIRKGIETAIANGDQRLKHVHVTLEAPKANDKALRFRIDAMLMVAPLSEPVMFDAMLKLSNKNYQVKA